MDDVRCRGVFTSINVHSRFLMIKGDQMPASPHTPSAPILFLPGMATAERKQQQGGTRWFMAATLALLPIALLAQTSPAVAAKPLPTESVQVKQEPKPTPVKTMDTGESIGFMGRKLWFEVRRRMNLTTEQEEAQQRAAEKAYRLKVGGIRMEKNEEPPPDAKKP